jgi:hypothetical protein
MRKVIITVMVLLVVGTVAAAKMKAYVSYDKTVDFSAIETFEYFPTLDTSVVEAAPPVHEMIKLLVIRQLQDGGMKRVEGEPDVYVTYHTDQNQALRINTTMYRYHTGVGWWVNPYWGGGMDVSSYARGTLVVDIWNPENEELIWRGVAVGVVPDNPSPDKAQKTIEKALNLMGKEFRKMRKKDQKN